ncbi:MAG: 4-hydroxybenzoate octaprenyltransferase [Proteobacteria bacterium]|nr:4-hydroxybenzoate octaprenyltransferase [Pseudomonadota bacterium]
MNQTLSALNLDAHLRLARLDRPVGSLLLLWPTLAALWAAAEGLPPLLLIVVFVLGTFLMRSAGCVVNDIADRNIDSAVRRTLDRPLATGELTVRDAWLFFTLLIGLCAGLLVFLNPFTRWLAFGGVLITMAYPLMKRFTHMPQLVLGAAFSWGIVMAYGAVQGSVPAQGWLLFVASLFWIVAYDTLYAMADREDDLKIGVKSTAILFGNADRLAVGLLQALTLFTLVLFGQRSEFGWIFYAGLAAVAALFIHQQRLIVRRAPANCIRAFANNIWVGFCLFAAVVCEFAVHEFQA